MDIIFKLPLPKEVCSKIFMYTCKSRHCDLHVAILKKIIGLSIYNKLIKNGGIMLDGDGNVVEFRVFYKHCNDLLGYYEGKQLKFDIEHLKSHPNLTFINLYNTGVSGDIAHLKSLPKLTVIDLSRTGVMGDIAHLKSLPNLTAIDLSNTGVTGNIEHLKSLLNLTLIDLDDTGVTGDIAHLASLQNLTNIYLRRTGVTGNIEHLKSVLNLTMIGVSDTGVTGDKEAFNEYRQSEGLPYCIIYI